MAVGGEWSSENEKIEDFMSQSDSILIINKIPPTSKHSQVIKGLK